MFLYQYIKYAIFFLLEAMVIFFLAFWLSCSINDFAYERIIGPEVTSKCRFVSDDREYYIEINNLWSRSSWAFLAFIALPPLEVEITRKSDGMVVPYFIFYPEGSVHSHLGDPYVTWIDGGAILRMQESKRRWLSYPLLWENIFQEEDYDGKDF